jgi:hypothetical protein
LLRQAAIWRAQYRLGYQPSISPSSFPAAFDTEAAVLQDFLYLREALGEGASALRGSPLGKNFFEESLS